MINVSTCVECGDHQGIVGSQRQCGYEDGQASEVTEKCRDCSGTGRCSRCEGSGRIKHVCRFPSTLEVISEKGAWDYRVTYWQCKICDVYCKSVYQRYSAGGSDCDWLALGESRGGLTFTQEELDKVLKAREK